MGSVSAIDPQDIGRDYEAIIRVNSQSGKGGVAYLLETDHAIKLPKSAQAQFSQAIQKITDATGKEINSDTIWATFRSEFIEQPNASFALVSFSSRALKGSDEREQITAVVKYNGKDHVIEAEGNGPVSAFVDGIRDTFGLDFQLTDYSEHTRSVGSRAEAAAYIELDVPSAGGRSVFGVGIDTRLRWPRSGP